MAVGVARGLEDRGAAVVADAREHRASARRGDGVDRDLHVAGRRVLEPDRHRQTARELPVDLALHRARADRAPAHRVGEVLRRDGVEELGADREPEREHVEDEGPRRVEPVVHPEARVEAGIVDESLPADRGPRLLEVDAHDDDELALDPLRDRGEALRVVEPGDRIVNRAGTDDHEHPVVGAVQDRGRVAPAPHDDGARVVDQRELLAELPRRDERADVARCAGCGRDRSGSRWFLPAGRALPVDRPAAGAKARGRGGAPLPRQPVRDGWCAQRVVALRCPSGTGSANHQ